MNISKEELMRNFQRTKFNTKNEDRVIQRIIEMAKPSSNMEMREVVREIVVEILTVYAYMRVCGV